MQLVPECCSTMILLKPGANKYIHPSISCTCLSVFRWQGSAGACPSSDKYRMDLTALAPRSSQGPSVTSSRPVFFRNIKMFRPKQTLLLKPCESLQSLYSPEGIVQVFTLTLGLPLPTQHHPSNKTSKFIFAFLSRCPNLTLEFVAAC